MYDWQTYLSTHAIRNTPKDNDAADIALLTDYSILTVTGPDAMKFLQGQCTCDFTVLDSEIFTYGAHCNPKGRMLSQFVAAPIEHKDSPSIGLRVHHSIAHQALEALKKYAVFSKVELEINSSLAAVGILKPSTELRQLLQIEKLKNGSYHQQPGLTALAHSPDHIELWMTSDSLDHYWKNLTELNVINDSLLWHRLNIQNGHAFLTSELIEQLLPQEINLQYLEGISFQKGCYTGQEIIARLHYKGALKKHMYRGQVDCEFPPQTGDTLFANGTKCGQIINIAQLSTSHFEFLALCNDTSIENDTVLIKNDNSANVEWLAIPYAIT